METNLIPFPLHYFCKISKLYIFNSLPRRHIFLHLKIYFISDMVIEVPQTERVNDVDVFLSTQDGQIQRPKGPNCRHPVRQKCTNCLPVDVSDIFCCFHRN